MVSPLDGKKPFEGRRCRNAIREKSSNPRQIKYRSDIVNYPAVAAFSKST